jgi:hypothetical protein
MEIAKEAGIYEWWDNGGDWRETFNEHLKAFAALVREDERERIKQANAPEIERVNAHIKQLEDAVLAEREACANVCEDQTQEYYSDGSNRAMNYQCAEAIRARGENT